MAVRNIALIKASQRECMKAVQDITSLLLFVLHHLSPSSIEGVDGLDLPILEYQKQGASQTEIHGNHDLDVFREKEHAPRMMENSVEPTTVLNVLPLAEGTFSDLRYTVIS